MFGIAVVIIMIIAMIILFTVIGIYDSISAKRTTTTGELAARYNALPPYTPKPTTADDVTLLRKKGYRICWIDEW